MKTPVRALVRRLAALLVGGGLDLLVLVSDATGCPVCFAADERTRTTFVQTAVLLSLLPFALFTAVALWFHHELRTNRGTGEEPGEAARPGPEAR